LKGAVTAEKNDLESNDILRFEQLRRELIELEKRVQKSANDAQEVCISDTGVILGIGVSTVNR
jgi:hypothetical protein